MSIQVWRLSLGGGATAWGEDHGGAEPQEVGWLKSRDREQRERIPSRRERGKNGGRGPEHRGGLPPSLPLQTLKFSGFPLTYGPNSGRVKSRIALVKNYCFG